MFGGTRGLVLHLDNECFTDQGGFIALPLLLSVILYRIERNAGVVLS